MVIFAHFLSLLPFFCPFLHFHPQAHNTTGMSRSMCYISDNLLATVCTCDDSTPPVAQTQSTPLTQQFVLGILCPQGNCSQWLRSSNKIPL